VLATAPVHGHAARRSSSAGRANASTSSGASCCASASRASHPSVASSHQCASSIATYRRHGDGNTANPPVGGRLDARTEALVVPEDVGDVRVVGEVNADQVTEHRSDERIPVVVRCAEALDERLARLRREHRRIDAQVPRDEVAQNAESVRGTARVRRRVENLDTPIDGLAAELLPQPALAEAGVRQDRHQSRASLPNGRVERRSQRRHFRLAADHRRTHARERRAGPRSAPAGAPEPRDSCGPRRRRLSR
jgi:hypothetical protein